jgi:hypothetical protein
MPSLKFVLLGHGTNDIPPKGWGAVESLIWTYYQELTALGHQVHIINTMDNDEIIYYFRKHTCDIIHLHDDSLIQLLPYLNHTGLVVLTSHYPAIHDRSVWNDKKTGYNFESTVIQPLLHYVGQLKRLVIGTLCQKDMDAFIAMGVPRNQIFLMVNGASAKEIECDDRPTNGLTICLAQISERKRQKALFGIPSVVFYGPSSEPVNDSAYKGELSAIERNRTLTEYENMVLLSTAEASPLAIKEGLMAGLGLVMSEAVASEIPTNPYSTIIPEAQIWNRDYVEEAIRENRRQCFGKKKDIRAYAKALWDWPVLVQTYVANIERFLATIVR